MLSGIKQQSIVGKDGKIEIQAPELPEGTAVEVIVLVAHSESDPGDLTSYLLSTEANRSQLLEALHQVETQENRIVIEPEEWHEKYCIRSEGI